MHIIAISQTKLTRDEAVEVVNALRSMGLNIAAKDTTRERRSPLDLARDYNQDALAAVLTEKYAELYQDQQGGWGCVVQ